MPRDASGNMTLPVGNPVVSGTAISSAVQNATMADLAAEIQDSLSRSGKGGMLVPFQNADGVVGAPGITFTNEPTSGWFRNAAGDIRAAVLGVWRLACNALGVLVNGTLGVTGAATFSSTVSATGRITASAGVAGLLATDIPTNYQIATTSTGSFDTTSTSFVDVTNAVTPAITTNGRPVVIMVVPDGTASQATVYANNTDTVNLGGFQLQVLRDATPISRTGATAPVQVGSIVGFTTEVVGNVLAFDTPAAGTYTYKLQAKASTATSRAFVTYVKLVAIEL